jgi:hypothetical protein
MGECDTMKTDSKHYVMCPNCGKKLFRTTDNSNYANIFVWCKFCKKEIKCDKKSH